MAWSERRGKSMTEEPDDSEQRPQWDFSRRSFLSNTGLMGGAMAFAGAATDVARGEDLGRERQQAPEPGRIQEDALIFFDIDQAETVQAMAARIMPSDEYGPGAVEAGVVYFIDRQMEQKWGHGARHYMEGPFDVDAPPNFGHQSHMTPREEYQHGLQFLQEYCRNEFDSSFVELDAGQQDQVLKALQEDEVDTFEGIHAWQFFETVRINTLEGMYCDPVYDGNRDMVGWKMKRFPGTPGALGSYKQLVDREDFIRIPPRSVADDVRSVGLQEPAGSGDGGSQSHDGPPGHDHGPRYELVDEDDEEEEDHHG